MKYTDLVKKEKNRVCKTDCGDLNIVYNQTYLNKTNSALNVDENMTKIDYIIKCFSEGLLVSWDLTDDKGKKYPITKKELEKFNMDFLVGIYELIQADMNDFFKKR